MARTQMGTYNLIAAFTDMHAAEVAINQLNDAAIPADDISLIGKQGEQVVADQHTRDDQSIASAVKGTIAGTLGGGVLGGLGGFLLGLAALAIPGVGPVMTAGIWATAIAGGATAGAVGGGFIGTVAGTELGEGRSEAFNTYLTEGRVLVGVHGETQDAIEHAFTVLSRQQPIDIERFGSGFRQTTETGDA
ncbi:MAG: DUF1269 domain-containing protein [Dehalococcoidia bacterium]